MADLNRLYDALRKADAAGDTESAQKLAAYIRTVSSSAGSQQFQATPAPNPTDGNNFFENTLIGVGKGFHDVGQGVGQRARSLLESMGGKDLADKAGLPTSADVAESRKIDAPLMNTAGGAVGNFVGKAIPATAAMLVPGGQSLAGSIATGAALGAAEPAVDGESVLKNAAFGGAGGAAGYGAAKLVGGAVNAVKAAAQPFYEKGQNAIAGSAVKKAAGTEADLDAAIQALKSTKSAVPGVELTAGQASGNAGIAALERAASATDPVVTKAFADRMTAQNAARVSMLEDMAGTNGARDFFAADRDAVANQLYKKAFDAGIDADALTPAMRGQITQLMKRPSIQTAIQGAKQLAAEDGMKLTDMTSIEGMHYMKQALDDQISSSVRTGTDTLTSKLMGTKQKLLNLMDTLSPAYGEARKTFAEMSKPISQMDVAQEIADKSIAPLTGNLQPNAFAKNISDSVAKRATGFSGASLENTMTPEQLAGLDAIKEDLARSVFAQNAGRGAGSDTVQKLAYSNMLSSMKVPEFVRSFAPSQVIGNVAGRAADAAYGRANRELSSKLAESLLDPNATARMVSDAVRAAENSMTVSNVAGAVAPYSGAAGIGIINSRRNRQ